MHNRRCRHVRHPSLFAAAFVTESRTYAEQRVEYAVFAFVIAIGPVLHIAGLGLTMLGLFARTKPLYAVLGLVLSLLPLFLAAF